MAKITNVTILDETTIQLNVDAKVGDIINLLDISKIDNAIIKQKLEEAKNKEIQKEVDQVKSEYENRLQEKIKSTKAEVELEKQKELQELTLQLQSLKSQNENFEQTKKLELEAQQKNLELEAQALKLKLQQEINELKQQLEIDKLKLENEYKEKIHTQEKEYQNMLKEKEDAISSLQLTKSNLTVKKIGEQLEAWCNNEYENYAQCGFETCSWEKDNLVVKDEEDTKGTKADYIFKVFATSDKKPQELLTSVTCEMKNESPNSKNKKKNADHYSKLDKDRKKKNCEYALLISELEWDQPNDLPIKKVKEYDKMFVVRPQYFINFLSIITSISLKFKDLILTKIKDEETFKDSIELKNEFESFKDDIFKLIIEKTAKELNKIIDNANKIKKCSEDIIMEASDLVNKTLEKAKNKIDNFKIDKLTKKIDKINIE